MQSKNGNLEEITMRTCRKDPGYKRSKGYRSGKETQRSKQGFAKLRNQRSSEMDGLCDHLVIFQSSDMRKLAENT